MLQLNHILSSIFFVALLISVHGSGTGTGTTNQLNPKVAAVCGRTRYPNLCFQSLAGIPDSVSHLDLAHISVNMTLHKVGKALYGAAAIANMPMNPRVRSTYQSCFEMVDDSMDQLGRSLNAIRDENVGTRDDVMTWLSAALTNHDTCMDELDEVSGYVKDHMVQRLKDLSGLISNCLTMFTVSDKEKDFSGIPIENRRRLLGGELPEVKKSGFPAWVRRGERRLLQLPVAAIKPDVIVSQDGNGTYKKISQAIKAAPSLSTRRFIIYVKAGRYEENNLKVGRKKTNLMFIGDGKGLTIISGGKSVQDNLTTFHTAAFAATGAGFIARDITFENWAGPGKHQAVALRVGADHAVVYRCNIIGYQDTLYVHSNRQFFRECDVYGTVDFIFGNAAVVFQNCSIYARKPMAQQKNTITAQNRKDPNQVTGISIHSCRILPTSDLSPVKASFETYLGRPWKLYSRVVYMQSYIGDHVHPRGWLEWNATSPVDSLYYGEYKNGGPGGALGQRVNWLGYHVITLPQEANKFSVGQFISGTSWLPSTGVAFLAGLAL